MSRIGLCLVFLLAPLLIAACHETGSGKSLEQPGRTPDYAAVADAYNKRVSGLERLWSRGTVRVSTPDERGVRQQFQVEANLQLIRPDRVNVSLDKAGTVAVLGSDPEQYWYIDLQAKPPLARVGHHAQSSPPAVARLGIPVYPLDLVELIAISPLPTSPPGVGTGEIAGVRWSDDGRTLIVTTPGRTGWRRLYLDPQTYEASRVELGGAGGRVLARAELGRYTRVEGAEGRIASEVNVSIDDNRTQVRLRFDEPSAIHTIKPVAFDLDRLLKAYDIQHIESLDSPS